MKKFVLILGCCLFLFGCSRPEKSDVVIHREFYGDLWERFDYVSKTIEITEPTTYTFQIENRMPITPLVGVRELTLRQNNQN